MKRTIKDERDGDNLPAVPVRDLLLYHWSPTSNRNGIRKRGLDIGRRSLQGDWKPPYVALADDPILAWILSGNMWPSIKSWDLWMVNMNTQTSFKHHELILDTFYDTGRHYIKEYRIYTRIYKRDVKYLATRRE